MGVGTTADVARYVSNRLNETGVIAKIAGYPLSWYKTKEDAIKAGTELWGEGVECCVVDEEKKQYMIRNLNDDMFDPIGIRTRHFKYVTISDEEPQRTRRIND